jgi:hypothetical protein
MGEAIRHVNSGGDWGGGTAPLPSSLSLTTLRGAPLPLRSLPLPMRAMQSITRALELVLKFQDDVIGFVIGRVNSNGCIFLLSILKSNKCKRLLGIWLNFAILPWKKMKQTLKN